MTKPTILNVVDYLNLEINSEMMKKYDKCEQSTQSMPVEHSDIATEVSRMSMSPPIRPPPLLIKRVKSLDQDSTSVASFLRPDKDRTFKGKIKNIKNGTMKVTHEMYEKMSKKIKGISKVKKGKKRFVHSPIMKASTLPIDEKHSEELKRQSAIKSPTVKEFSTNTRRESPIRSPTLKEASRLLTSISSSEVISETSILSSYKVMTLISDYTTENSAEPEEINMDDLFEHWISGFIDTCQRQIKNIVVATNNNLAQYLDLNGTVLSTDHDNFIKVNTIPTWNQVRILEDGANQKYIALKKSHSLSWFIMPRESPKLNQRWVCYPINSMNTLENEIRLTEENSTQWLILRMIMLKCFNKIYKSDIVPIKFDINDILLVSSTCGFIVVFKEGIQDLDISSMKILRAPTLAEVPKQWTCAKTDVKNAVVKFFYRLNIISVLISSIWPLDNLAYILVTLIMESDN